MPKNEEGEFELVVGNKQLLSIVFIMFVLFGVVFSMGYFVGRNSAPEPPPGRTDTAQARVPAADGSSRAATPSAPAAPPAGAESLAPGEAKVVATQPVSTQPAQPPTAPAEAAKPPATPPPAPKPAEVEKPPADAAGPGPLAGQVYLQVAAVKKTEAEMIVDVLKNRGMQALVAPVVPGQPEDALWRALVGPLKDAAAVARARSDLQAAGFKEVIIRKY